MTELLATYWRDGEVHRIELVAADDGSLVLDRGIKGVARVVAELDRSEGREHALAVLREGRYLDRARRGERGLACPLSQWTPEAGERLPRAA